MAPETLILTTDPRMAPGEYVFQDQTGRRQIVIVRDTEGTAVAMSDRYAIPPLRDFGYVYSNCTGRQEPPPGERVGRNAFAKFCQPKRRLV